MNEDSVSLDVMREMEQEMQMSALSRNSLMDNRMLGETFDKFTSIPQNEIHLKLCKRYVEKFDEMSARNQGLLFYGGVGTGKTFAAACIANALLAKGVSVVMTSFVKLIDAMQGFKDKDESIIEKLLQPRLLIIDDLGTERSSDYALEKVYNIVDSRYRTNRPMILTTNIGMEDMKNTVDLRYMRIYDRIFEMCYPLKFIGGSWRRREATRRWEEMKKFMDGG